MGVSGGGDSLALAVILKRAGFRVLALIVDHGLRAESSIEAQDTHQKLRVMGIEARILTLDKSQFGQGGIQENARDLRLDALCNEAHLLGSPCIMLGHQYDDHIETVALRREKNSGLSGLRGIAPVSMRGRIALIRPMLDIKRTELRAYLRALRVDWIDDPSNSNRKFSRVRIRQDLNAADYQTLERLSLKAKSSVRPPYELAADSVRLCAWGGFEMASSYFSENIEAEKIALLRSLIFSLYGDYPPSFGATEKLYRAKSGTLSGVRLHGEKGRYYLSRELRDPEISAVDFDTLWDKRWRYTGASVEGAEIGALGESVRKYRKDRNVPANCLKAVPVLRKDGRIIGFPRCVGGWNENLPRADFVYSPKNAVWGFDTEVF